jgi:hypothetical protein
MTEKGRLRRHELIMNRVFLYQHSLQERWYEPWQ